MKKFILVLFAAIIAFAGYFFMIQKPALPKDFNMVIMLWQKERAKELENIFSIWTEMPIGQGERTTAIDMSYSGFLFSGKFSGPISSDITSGKSLWKTNLDLTGKSSIQGLPLPSQIALTGSAQIGQGDFFYLIPGQIQVALPSQSGALQKQLQEVADLAAGKTLKIADKNSSLFQISKWTSFFTDLTTKPVFLLARTEGELAGRYEYTISLAPSYTDLFQSIIVPMTNCQLSIAKRNINNFILDCRSAETRIVWTSQEDKIPVNPQYLNTYVISLSTGEKPKWEFEQYQNEKKIGEIEGYAERVGNQLIWDATTQDIPAGYIGTLKGTETRTSSGNIDITPPQTFVPWEEISKELVY